MSGAYGTPCISTRGSREPRNLVFLTTVSAIAPPSINHRPMTGNSFGFSRVIPSYPLPRLEFELLRASFDSIALPLPDLACDRVTDPVIASIKVSKLLSIKDH